MKRGRRPSRGFTLVEMVVATLMLAIGVAACLGAIAVSTRTAGVGKEYSTAALLADQRFSELETDPNGFTTGEQSGDFGADYPGFKWTQSIEQTEYTSLLRVQLNIEWSDGISTRSVLFSTYEQQPDTTNTGTGSTSGTRS